MLGAGDFIIPYNILFEGLDIYEKELKIMKSINSMKKDKKNKFIKLSLQGIFNYDTSNLNQIGKTINNLSLNSTNGNIKNQSSQENSKLNSISLNDNKKVTIKDLCPEDKGKIGELLKKLAQEKEEKESLLKTVEDEKKKNERMETILKEK